MATVYRIHPAIGIARVGNSPHDFFLGPERPGERPDPPDGFKDEQCRIKRQAQRFRIFAHHDDGTVTEVDHGSAEITWTVELANTKAAHPARGNAEPVADMEIKPGLRSLSGPLQSAAFDTGTIHFSTVAPVRVPLGEIRTDADNHLIVLGAHGQAASPRGDAPQGFWGGPGWYDDVADGPVTASLKLRADGSTPTVEGAWIIVAPPKFAPHQDSIITLYDRLLQTMADRVPPLVTEPATTSYTHDVWPILQRTRDTRWVDSFPVAKHAWPDPVPLAQRAAIFNRLAVPVGVTEPPVAAQNMPILNDSGTQDNRLTRVQFEHLRRWKAGNVADYSDDWPGSPPPPEALTPAGMDRAALDACVGGAFFPGIEAGGLPEHARPILDGSRYMGAFRLDHSKIAAGGITHEMALPWQLDFDACGTHWWPVPRPNLVRPAGSSTSEPWKRPGDDMITGWSRLGFVVDQPGGKFETERCATPVVTLLTEHLDFGDVPQGPLGTTREAALALLLEVSSPSAAVTFSYASGGGPSHVQLIAATTSDTVGPTAGDDVAVARLWVIFRTAATLGPIPPQTVTVTEDLSGQTWSVLITGRTVARQTTVVSLVLDRSGSMAEDCGNGQPKHEIVRAASSLFVDLMLQGDGLGVVTYNDDDQPPLLTLGTLGAGGLSDAHRLAAQGALSGPGLSPQGGTSIGDGLAAGHALLPSAGFDRKALVVLTDGVENEPAWIADVAGSIQAQTFAIGVGTPMNTSAPALQALSGNHGGYLLITGGITPANTFVLHKHFLQILAGVSQSEVISDPDGVLLPGRVVRVPFEVSVVDTGIEVILVTPVPELVDFRLETPLGEIIEPWSASAASGITFQASRHGAFFRLVLPARPTTRPQQSGRWHVLLQPGRPRLRPTQDRRTRNDLTILRGMRAAYTPPLRSRRGRLDTARTLQQALSKAGLVPDRYKDGLPYSVVVHGWSSTSLQVTLRQSGHEPGATVHVRASVTRAGMPWTRGVHVRAEITGPNGRRRLMALASAQDGDHAASFETFDPGIYRVRVLAHGLTEAGDRFVRERTRDAAVWLGGDHDARRAAEGGALDDRLCAALSCLAKEENGPIRASQLARCCRRVKRRKGEA